MAVRMPRHLKSRYARSLAPGRRALEALVEAIQTLLQVTSKEDPLFLVHGLELLVAHLHCARAILVTVAGSVLETQWWSPDGLYGPGAGPLPLSVAPGESPPHLGAPGRSPGPQLAGRS